MKGTLVSDGRIRREPREMHIDYWTLASALGGVLTIAVTIWLAVVLG